MHLEVWDKDEDSDDDYIGSHVFALGQKNNVCSVVASAYYTSWLYKPLLIQSVLLQAGAWVASFAYVNKEYEQEHPLVANAKRNPGASDLGFIRFKLTADTGKPSGKPAMTKAEKACLIACCIVLWELIVRILLTVLCVFCLNDHSRRNFHRVRYRRRRRYNF